MMNKDVSQTKKTNKNTSLQWDSPKIIPNIKFLQDPKSYLNELADGSRNVLSIFISFGRSCKRIHFFQAYLAKRCNLSLRQVNRIIKKFEQDGLIAKKYNHMRNSYYRVTDLLLTPAKKLLKVLIATCFFAFGILLSKPMSPPFSFKPDVTEIRRKTIRSNINHKLSNHLFLNNSINSRCRMSEFKKEDFIPEIVQSLKGLNLTWDQKFKLSAYPFKALSYAFNQFRYSSTNIYGTKNNYSWFKYLCEEYCTKEKISPNWRLYYQLVDVYGTEEPKKEKVEMKELPVARQAYSYKLSADYVALGKYNPLDVFIKKISDYKNAAPCSWINPQDLYQMSVVNMVNRSFLGYCEYNNITPDSVLSRLDSLIDSEHFIELLQIHGPEDAGRFIIICLDAIIADQEARLRDIQNKLHYRRIPEQPVKFDDKIIYITRNVDEFIRSDSYKYISDVIGELVFRQKVYTLIENWIKIVQPLQN